MGELEGLSEEQRKRLAAEILRRYPALAPANLRLAGFVELRADERVEPAELLAHARGRLPEHMIPESVTVLERLPRTPGGKIDRRALESIQAEKPRPPAPDAARPQDETEQILAEIWRGVLDLEEVSVNDDFFEVGGDSLLSIRVLSRAARAGVSISPQQFFEKPTIAGMAAAARLARGADEEPVTGEAPLTPIQHWFFENIPTEQHYWNQSVMLALGESVDRKRVASAVDGLVRHHDALRLRFVRGESGWRQVFPEPSGEAALRVEDLGGIPESDRLARIEAAAAEAQAAGDLENGPLARFVLFELGARKEKRLLVIVHHLLVDDVSWSALLEDLDELLQGRPLPPKTISYKQWAERLVEYAHDPEMLGRRRFWLEQREPASATPGEWPWAAGPAREGPGESSLLELDQQTTLRLLEPPEEVQTQDLMLTALLQAWNECRGRRELFLDLEGHGRDVLPGLDASRTAGWFTTVFPVLLRLEQDALGGVRRQLRATPDKGASHGLLRYLATDAELREALRSRGRPAILFNYLGANRGSRATGLALRTVDEPQGSPRSPRIRRAYALEINAWIEDESLRFRWTYDDEDQARLAVAELLAAFERALRAATSAKPEVAGLGEDAMARLAGLLDEDE